ncbi:MAG: LacI family DNA-binding transcriptional regulator [Eubacteriales bacterium]|nr:LacI family DNA-binding transcriptional regulator [Eubacteriales bacterium]
MQIGKHITIKDVAQKAGVAISTVSRVFNGLDRVSPETRAKVELAVKELEYSPNSRAVSMITGHTKTIQMLVPDFVNDFYGSVIQGVEEVLRNNDYMLMVCSTGDSQEADLSAYIKRFFDVIDGVIAIPSNANIGNIQSLGKPVIFVDRAILGSGIAAVTADNAGGTYLLTKELIRAGHKKIAVISGDMQLNVGQQRLWGYRCALSDSGIAENADYIACGAMYEETGYRSFKRLMQLSNPPTGVVACNNLICIGCVRAAGELGLRIGKDISLVGFDDHVLASIPNPGITVVAGQTIEMGRRAANMILARIRHKDIKEAEVSMPVELIRRNSIRDLRASPAK